MSRKHKVFDSSKPYFITMSVNQWAKIFNNTSIINIVINSLKYCQLNKGLEIYSYCIMPDHIHMICRSICEYSLSEIIRDFKKYTSRSIIKHLINTDNNISAVWLEIFRKNDSKIRHIYRHHVWQEGFYPIELSSNSFIDQKIEYINNNPVKAGMVDNAEDYLYSSARNAVGLRGYLEVVTTYKKWETYK